MEQQIDQKNDKLYRAQWGIVIRAIKIDSLLFRNVAPYVGDQKKIKSINFRILRPKKML